jgi:hypothetical protein
MRERLIMVMFCMTTILMLNVQKIKIVHLREI